jgi:LuxR family transcriptional regulator, maltose regulon positive regulatory protein
VVVSNVRKPSGSSHQAGSSHFDLLASKLRRPVDGPGSVRRSSLIERLTREESRPIVSVVAPAGYGKTTLLSQWAEREDQAFAWVSLDERDNDPKVLLTYIAEALDAIEPVGARVFHALASPVSSVFGSVIPRLGSAFASTPTPVALVLDDVHLLDNRECRAALSVLADHVPARSRLVLAGRAEPPLRIARLRAEGKITEIGPADLSLTRAEAASLLTGAGVVLEAEEVAELHRRTEGWPAGLYLAALAIRAAGPSGTAASFGGADLFVTQYVDAEFLAQTSREQRAFLTRASVLERMSGPLCDAALDLTGSGATLAELARSNLLLVPLDRVGQWYRYHHLFRDMLLAELDRQEPGLIAVLRRRAAGWCLRNDLPEEALEYSMAGADAETAAQLVEKFWIPAYYQGRTATIQRWLSWLEEQGAVQARHPMVGAAACIISAWMGRPAEAVRWADIVERWHEDPARPADAYAEAWVPLLRALLCRDGVEQMIADADETARLHAAANMIRPSPVALQGIARVLSGDLDGGDAYFVDAVRIWDIVGARDFLAVTLSERSLVAMARGDWSQAEALADQAHAVLRRAQIEDCYAAPLVCAVQARTAIHRGEVTAARQQLVRAQRSRPLLTYAIPHVAVQARIELARVHLALADLAGARTLTREIDEVLKRRPGLGTLVGEAEALRARLAQERGSTLPGASALTDAELRLLPLLSTHLPVPEIAAELVLSPHTIKSRMKSIYRKLDGTTRHQVVSRARELGLLEG